MSKRKRGPSVSSLIDLLKWLLRKKRARKLVIVVLCASMLMLMGGWALGSAVLLSSGYEHAWENFNHVIIFVFLPLTVAALFASGALRKFMLKLSRGHLSVMAWAQNRKSSTRDKTALRVLEENMRVIRKLLCDAHPSTGELPAFGEQSPDQGLGARGDEPTP